MVNHSYPAELKTLLKASPSCMMFMGFGLLFTTAIYAVLYHPHDRIEKFYFKSGKFERLVRKRDEKLRYYHYPYINW